MKKHNYADTTNIQHTMILFLMKKNSDTNKSLLIWLEHNINRLNQENHFIEFDLVSSDRCGRDGRVKLPNTNDYLTIFPTLRDGQDLFEGVSAIKSYLLSLLDTKPVRQEKQPPPPDHDDVDGYMEKEVQRKDFDDEDEVGENFDAGAAIVKTLQQRASKKNTPLTYTPQNIQQEKKITRFADNSRPGKSNRVINSSGGSRDNTSSGNDETNVDDIVDILRDSKKKSGDAATDDELLAQLYERGVGHGGD
jgi:hypothetical protein